MCSVKVKDGINANFYITNVILSKSGQFTIEDVWEDIQNYNKNNSINRKMIEKFISRLQENYYVEMVGNSYKVVPSDQSIRWGVESKF